MDQIIVAVLLISFSVLAGGLVAVRRNPLVETSKIVSENGRALSPLPGALSSSRLATLYDDSPLRRRPRPVVVRQEPSRRRRDHTLELHDGSVGDAGLRSGGVVPCSLPIG